MSAMTANVAFPVMENLNISHSPPKPASPVSPSTVQPTNQQSIPTRSYLNLKPEVRGQTPPFPQTPIHGVFLDLPPGVTFAEFLRTWTDNHVARWLADIKCGSHAEIFKVNDIRGDILLELDQLALKEIGVSSIGDRLRVLNAVKVLRQRSSSKALPKTGSLPELAGDVQPKTMLSDKPQLPSGSGSRTAFRRLEIGRPAPLQLSSNVNRSDLPGLIREQPPDSARSNVAHPIRPLPQPNPATALQQPNTNPTPSTSHSASLRANLPPLPPPPRGQPPLPPSIRVPTRPNGWATPTQNEAPAYTTQALPPPPQNHGHHVTPTGNWGGHQSSTDARPNTAPGGKPTVVRSTSPLQPARLRAGLNSAAHGRNGSLGTNSPSGKQSLRTGSNSHPYAVAQPSLLSPPNLPQHNLSPIEEAFVTQHSSSSASPSPPSQVYSVGRGPFNPTPSFSNTPYTLDDLRRKLVKFILPDEGLSFTIDVASCKGGVEVLEKVLKKFGKGGSRSSDGDISGAEYGQTDEGGLSIDGWGVYLDMGQVDGPGEPLNEAELMSICHASPDHPTREHGLTLRRTNKARRYDERSGSPSQRLAPGHESKKRASTISVLSGLGVQNPEKAFDPPSPTSGRYSPSAQNAKRPSKLRNFFGQRPPSELITNHLTEYFPFTEKKVLERTARHSMMRSNTSASTRRESGASFTPPVSSQSGNSQGQNVLTTSPTRNFFSSLAPQVPDKHSQTDNESVISSGEDIPRMSLSTDDGRSVDLHPDPFPSISQPQLLPPIPIPKESFSESLEGITGSSGQRAYRPISRVMSIASRRMSYMTELRSKRDQSDTASLMTVDEITAEVESRRVSQALDRTSDFDDWTKLDTPGDVEDASETLVDDDPEEQVDVEDEDEGTTFNYEEEEEGKGEPTITRKANKWIKGALIGAGSFGKVYLGLDASSGLLMAVKQVELPTGSAPNQERKKSMLSALEREIELLKNLQHENIVQYLYSSIDDDYLNIFLEYVPGGSVTALLSNYGAFEEPLVKNFVRQILQGLNYLHERDIIHRDIKGANILVDNKGGIKISDFGISKKVDDNLLSGHRNRPSLQGSVFWMAPEVVKQCGHTRKADIWSVGCLVVEMLTGEHPWAQLTQMQAIFKIGSSAKPTIPSDISAEAQQFLQRTFELDHEARPSAAELLQHSWISVKSSTHTPKGSAAKADLAF